jgi:hypothetical protein
MPFSVYPIRPSGIPPHIAILSQLDRVVHELRGLQPAMEGMSDRIHQGLIRELEARALQANAVTPAQLQAHVREVFNSMGLGHMADFMRQLQEGGLPGLRGPPQAAAPVAQPEVARRVYAMHAWGGRLHPIPEDFAFPKGGVRYAWYFWMCGSEQEGYPPLRILGPHDMRDKNMRRRLCDYQVMMRLLEAEVRLRDGWVEHPTMQQASGMFALGASVLETPALTARERERRQDQLCWRSVLNILRQRGNALHANRPLQPRREGEDPA